jgi:copper(I)-binding protein
VKAEQVNVRRLGFVLAVAAALFTSACAAGQHAGTADEAPTLNGVNASVGSMLLRALVIDAPSGATTTYPAGSDATVKLVLVNTGTSEDQLTAVTSRAFSDWGSFDTTAAADAVVSADAAALAPKSSAASSAAAPLPIPSRLIAIAPGSRTSWGTPEAKMALVFLHLVRAVYPGTTIDVTFTFGKAGRVTVAVPVGLSSSPHPSVVPEPSDSGAEG